MRPGPVSVWPDGAQSRMSSRTRPATPNTRPVTPNMRAVQTAARFALIPAIVAGFATWFAVGEVAALIVLVVVAVLLGWWAWAAGDWLVARHVSGRPADPASDARLCNLVEGLAAGSGVSPPKMVVVDSPGLNALVAGTQPRRAVLAVTSGLLAELNRIELEAVLAEELYLLRHDEVRPATVLAATFGLGRKIALTSDWDSSADQGAVSLTRYPPALASALEKIETTGAAVAGQPGYLAHMWLADPRGRGAGGPRRSSAESTAAPTGRLPLSERVEALREL